MSQTTKITQPHQTTDNIVYDAIRSQSHIPIDSPLSSISSTESIIIKKWYFKISSWIRIVLILIILFILIFFIVRNDITVYIISIFLIWMSNNIVIGCFAFIGIYILCNLIMIPGFLLTVGSGYLFVNLCNSFYGIFIAIFIVCVSRLLGWTISFLNARYLFKSFIHSLIIHNKKFIFINNVIKLNGFKVCLLLRLSPITPYGLLNYILGITEIKLKYYIYGHIGMIPDVILFCLIGASIASLSNLNDVGIASNKIILIIIIILTLFAISGIIYIGYLSKKELTKIAKNIHQNSDNADSSGTQLEMEMDIECINNNKNSCDSDVDIDE